jgi:hypothetical protein
LTTYCADYLYKERKSENEAVDYRRGIDLEYTTYVNEGNDYPLRDFREREGAYTRAIGYGKSAMVFHMLKLEVGEEVFWRALQDFYRENLFKKADWEAMQSAFEKRSGKDLGWFFQQWVQGKGAPFLKLEKAVLEQSPPNVNLKLNVIQTTPDLRVKVPISISYAGNENTHWFSLNPGANEINIECPSIPQMVTLDAKFDVFRILDRNEYPASLSEVYGAKRQIIALPGSASMTKFQAYKSLAEVLNSQGEAVVKMDTSLTLQDLRENSFLILGNRTENRLYHDFRAVDFDWTNWIQFTSPQGNFNLMGQSFNSDNCAFMITVRNPLNNRESIAVFSATTPQEINISGNKLIHYGKYSYLAFEEGKNRLKGNWEVKHSPLKQQF